MAPHGHLTWWFAEALRPPDGGGVEDEVALWSIKNHGLPLLRIASTLEGCACGHNLEPWEIRRGITVIFPADHAGD